MKLARQSGFAKGCRDLIHLAGKAPGFGGNLARAACLAVGFARLLIVPLCEQFLAHSRALGGGEHGTQQGC